MDGWLKSKSAMVTTSGNIIHTVIGNSEVPKNYLAVYKNDPDISDMYVGYPNGKFVDGSGWSPPADFNAAARPWFKKAVEVGVLTYSDPYIDAITKEYVVTAALPFKDGYGNVSSVAGADLLLTTLTKQAKSINLKGIGYAVLIDNNGVVLSHPDEKLIGKKLTEQDSTKAYIDVVNVAGTAFSEITALISSLSSQVDTIASSVAIIVGKSHGIVASVKEVGEISRQSSAQTQNVSAASQEQSASMQEIASASRSLAQMAEEPQSTVSRFKL